VNASGITRRCQLLDALVERCATVKKTASAGNKCRGQSNLFDPLGSTIWHQHKNRAQTRDTPRKCLNESQALYVFAG
jgi:hypothetical protein